MHMHMMEGNWKLNEIRRVACALTYQRRQFLNDTEMKYADTLTTDTIQLNSHMYIERWLKPKRSERVERNKERER